MHYTGKSNAIYFSTRFQVPPAAAAALVSGFLRDLIAARHLEEDLAYLVVDPSKMRRAREAVMGGATAVEDTKAKEEIIEAIYFDGRKDKTRVMMEGSDGILHPRMVREEHISVTAEPKGRYIAHFTPEQHVHPDKPSKKVAEGLYDVLVKCEATETCYTIGGDSYNGNTGWKGGANAHLEKLLGHKCYWAVCMSHTNELPLRHLIEHLDGKTSSKDGFSGPIGQLLSKVLDMEVDYDFRSLPGGPVLIPLSDKIINGLSTDACICYKYCQAIRTGQLTTQLAELKPGPIVHSRWLTTGEALLFMWTRKHGLTGKNLENLETLVRFCLDSYFKLFFDIKVKHDIIYGPTHVLTQVRILRTLPQAVQTIVTPYIRTGAWYSHSECVLLSLLGSQDKEDRRFAVEFILKIRGKNQFGSLKVRARRMPRLNLMATSLQTLIEWNVKESHEPVYTCKFNQEQLKQLIEVPFSVPKFSIHAQATERCVKQVTEAAAAVVGQERRDGYIRARIQSREEMPVFRTKKHIMALI